LIFSRAILDEEVAALQVAEVAKTVAQVFIER